MDKAFSECSPPTITTEKASSLISFIYIAQKKRISSMSGFNGLDEVRIEKTFENIKDEINLSNFTPQEIWWMIEYLEDKLTSYFNSKREAAN